VPVLTGIGVQGLADAFIKMRFPFESEEARKLNKEIFETIYFAALSESVEQAKVHGPYESYLYGEGPLSFIIIIIIIIITIIIIIIITITITITITIIIMAGSPVSQGILQHDMWGVSTSDRWPWEALREDIKKYGKF
jgi:ribonucleotide reductase alpha subunit